MKGGTANQLSLIYLPSESYCFLGGHVSTLHGTTRETTLLRRYFTAILKVDSRTNTISLQLSNEEKEEWAIERVSPGHWNSLSREVQLDLMHQGIWKQEVYDAWLKSVEEEEVSKRPTAYKQYRRYIKKNPTG